MAEFTVDIQHVEESSVLVVPALLGRLQYEVLHDEAPQLCVAGPLGLPQQQPAAVQREAGPQLATARARAGELASLKRTKRASLTPDANCYG